MSFGLSVIFCLLTVSGAFAGPIVSNNDIQPATEFCNPKETAGPEAAMIPMGGSHYFFGETEEDHCTLWITATGGFVDVTEAVLVNAEPPCKPFPESTYMTRYFELSGQPESFFDVHFGYSQADYDAAYLGLYETLLHVTWYDGNPALCDGEWIKALPTIVTDTPEGGAAMVTSNHMSLWSFWWEVRQFPPCPPVWVVSFTATAGDRFTLLQWITACELSNQGFYIERSTNGINWTRINTQIIEGAGTSPMSSEYTYTDQHLNNGVHYTYHLIYVHNNGMEYINEMTAEVTPSFLGEAIVITEYKLHQNYPNPFNPATTIVYDARAVPGEIGGV